ncbi:pyruvate, phosphate dikinase [Cutibacterium acnes JCM 18918]|nr:pyruvate, phosphate dikinase [Cutibacterium acnes JCM 18918]
MHEMITADTPEERQAAVDKILPMQQDDFEGIFTAMKGLPVTVRLLDPPLHEFLPNLVEQSLKVQKMENQGADAGELDKERRLLAQVKKLHEQNPMLGTRGCRLGMLYPEIPDMQARAIIRAVLSVLKKEGETVQIHIMIPLVFTPIELETHRRIVQQAIDEEFESAGTKVDVKIGTMIELPRAALVADKIAEVADFFSFGTNDLTQTTLGISRDDAENGFLTEYLRTKVLKDNPFASIDQEASASSLPEPLKRAARLIQSCLSGSAVSTVAIRTRSTSSTRLGSITCPARRSVYRSRGSLRPRQSSPSRRSDLPSHY